MIPIDQDPLTRYAIRQAEWEREVERMRLVAHARRIRRLSQHGHTPTLWTRIKAALLSTRRPMAERFTPNLMTEPRRSECDCAD